MTILLFSASFILIILLIKLLAGKNKGLGLKMFVIFGILVGIVALWLDSVIDDAFGASTPVNIRAENLTEKDLEIYVIAFWSNRLNRGSNYVTYDEELKPNETSDFWFENDGTTEFWIVAKTKINDIEYLRVVTEQKSEFDFRITEDTINDINKIQIAKQLIAEKDKSIQVGKFAKWANILLIGLLILSLFRIKTGVNNV